MRRVTRRRSRTFPDPPRRRRRKGKSERRSVRLVTHYNAVSCRPWVPTSDYLASHRLVNCVPLIGTSHCNFGCTGRFSSSTVCTSVCSYLNSVYLFIYGLHVLLLSWFTHSVPGSSQLTIIDWLPVWCRCHNRIGKQITMYNYMLCRSLLYEIKPQNWHKQILFACKAEEAARDSRRNKQDRYEEMRRRKDEEREAQERLLVRDSSSCQYFLFFSFVMFRTAMLST